MSTMSTMSGSACQPRFERGPKYPVSVLLCPDRGTAKLFVLFVLDRRPRIATAPLRCRHALLQPGGPTATEGIKDSVMQHSERTRSGTIYSCPTFSSPLAHDDHSTEDISLFRLVHRKSRREKARTGIAG